MLRLSKLADYAAVLLVQLGQIDDLATAASLAQSTGVPEPTVAKLLKGLASDGLVTSFRGARGGYRIGRPLKDISIASVISSVDGPIEVTACVNGRSCDAESFCALSGHWDKVNDAILSALKGISLLDMISADATSGLVRRTRAVTPTPCFERDI